VRDVAVVVPAGGIGTRVGSRLPKQFLSLGGAPILVATLRHFVAHPSIAAVVVPVPAAHVDRTRRLLSRLPRRAPLTVVAGGTSRQESVWFGLQAAPAGVPLVAVHDAVRPFIDRALLDRVVAGARDTGAAICALPIAETVKRVDGDLVQATVDRAGLWAVQTPQVFRAALLREAHEKARRDGVTGTDDAMLVERLGHPIRVVRGSEGNVKITTAEDLRRARARAGAERGVAGRAGRRVPR
jgi:2-C-methyl-D-erythritol 4-phosphate cytidylyltransferase